MTSGGRIACLQVPLFPLAARLRSEPDLKDEALVVLAVGGQAARVVAATRRARHAGVQAGMTLPQARARLPRLVARSRDDTCEQAAQEALLDVAEGFSPRIEDAGEGVAYLDAEGLERHFEGPTPERDLARALTTEIELRAALPVRVGVAASKLAARMAAAQPEPPTIVPTGDEAAFLAPLPLIQLTPESSILQTLGRWGIRSVGDFANLPTAEVQGRLGAAGQALHAIARGLDPQPLMPRQPPPTFTEGMELEWPLVALEPFIFAAGAALERLIRRMQTHGLACARLSFSLTLEPDGFHERTLTLPAPTRDIKTLLTLLRLDLEQQSPKAPTIAFTLTAHPDRPRHAQLSLFGPDALSPDRLATTLARLFALLGDDRVGAPCTVNGHRPERFALEPYAPPPPPETRATPSPSRGLMGVRTLRPQVPLEVITESAAPAEGKNGEAVATARPASVQGVVDEESTRPLRIRGQVRIASGPWVLEEGWWTDEPLTREYWDVELSDGGLYRIYRDRKSGDWLADGIYD